MRAYSNMSTYDFVQQIRDIAINAKASPLVIDQIDAIVDPQTDEEIEEQCQEREDEGHADGMSDMWDKCYDALAGVLSELGLDRDDSEALKTAILELKP